MDKSSVSRFSPDSVAPTNTATSKSPSWPNHFRSKHTRTNSLCTLLRWFAPCRRSWKKCWPMSLKCSLESIFEWKCTCELDESRMFIRRAIISVLRAFGVPSSPCIKFASSLTVLHKMAGTFYSINLSTKSTKIVFLERISSIPSVFSAKSSKASYVYSLMFLSLSLIKASIYKIAFFFMIVLFPNSDWQIFLMAWIDKDRISSFSWFLICLSNTDNKSLLFRQRSML